MLGCDVCIMVCFDVDIVVVMCNEVGEVIVGLISDVVEMYDVWIFVWMLKSNDFNWKFVDIDEV